MLTFFNNLSIKYKLFSYFIGIILIAVLSTGILTNIVFTNSIGSAASQSTVQAINQSSKSIEDYLMNIENIMNIIAVNPQTIEFLRNDASEAPDGRDLMESALRSFLTGITDNYGEIEGIAIAGSGSTFLSNEMYKYINDPLDNEGWYKSTVAKKGTINILSSVTGRKITEYRKISEDELISLAKAVIDPADGKVIGVIVTDLNISSLENILHSVNLSKTGFIYIADANGECIYSPINFIVPRVRDDWFKNGKSGIFVKYIQNQQFQFIYATSAYTGWKIVGVFSLSETLKEVTNIRYYSFYIFLIIAFISAGASYIFASSIANPINKLRKLMRKAEEGNLSVKFDVVYTDEIGHLGKSFNKMIAEIKRLVENINEEQKSKREAELKALQSQIKPHFLYNTLDTIHWMAKKYKADDVIEMISALTSLFRIGLSKGNEIIRVSDEIEHVRNYLIIQKVRYEEMLDYTIDVDENVKGLMVQKLILQPIVENSIYHGIKEKRDVGRISLRAEIKDEALVFTVTDDGVGIGRDMLYKLRQGLVNWKTDGKRSDNGYGLYNVNERIKLTYGEDFGLSIESVPMQGTVVVIRHPIINM